MSGFSPEDIIAHRFAQARRKGYDTLEVDTYLERVATHVGRIESELAQRETTERTALDVLQRAQVVADETIAAATREAEAIERNASTGLENARKDARAQLAAAQAEADRTLLSARAQAEAMVERAEERAKELEAAALARVHELDQVAHEVKRKVARSASELRTAGSQLVSMAEHFEFELATAGERIDDAPAVAIELVEERLPAQ